jgi:hypothetical protein
MPRVCLDRDDHIESGIIDFGFKHENLCVWLTPPEFGVKPPQKCVLQHSLYSMRVPLDGSGVVWRWHWGPNDTKMSHAAVDGVGCKLRIELGNRS